MRGSIKISDLDFLAADTGEKLLDKVALSVNKGEKIGITGPSGSGKTTLGMHLAGIHKKGLFGSSRGSVLLGIKECVDDDLPGFSGIVLQNPAIQLFCDNVFEEIALGPRSRGLTEPDVLNATENIIEMMGLADSRDADIRTLSHGLKQRVSIAGMLAVDPEVMVLDEPTNFLDPEAQINLFKLLDKINSVKGVTIIVIEHNKHMLLNWADRVLCMDKGRLIEGDRPDDLTRRRSEYVYRSERAETAEEVLRVNELNYSYGKEEFSIEGLSLKAGKGEVLAILGPNGSGKTTVLKLIKGLLRPSRGEVYIRGMKKKGLSDGVGIVFQDPDEQLFSHTVKEECGFIIDDRGFSENERLRRINSILTRVNLSCKGEQLPFSLSYGEKRRLTMASVLIGDPDILCLDEPTVGLDDDNLFMLEKLLAELSREGKTILLSTHDLDFAERVSHRKIFINKGRISRAQEGATK